MAIAKVTIAIDKALLKVVDLWVKEGRYASRAEAVQAALREKQARGQGPRPQGALELDEPEALDSDEWPES